MSIRLFNTAVQKVEEFAPQNDSEVNVYICGPTVYDEPHLGNLRPAVVFDVLHRLLRVNYPKHEVRVVQNFTDIDDKIIARANEQGVEIERITEKAIFDYNSALHRVNVLPAYATPRATDYVLSMSEAVEDLVNEGTAYVSEGHVLFDVSASKHVTELVPNNTELDAGARVQVASYKTDPRDFVLWKPAKEGEPSYPGPFDMEGRPGWHIECSSMIETIFLHKGHTREKYILDIHAGGMDLKFPHHQCEIMQTEGSQYLAGDLRLSRYWVHNGMLTVNGAKMAKSAGNFIRESETRLWSHGEALRYLLLTSHYRQPLDFTRERLDEAQGVMDRLYSALEAVWEAPPGSMMPEDPVRDALEDDLNTPEALAALHGLADYAFKVAGTALAYDAKQRLSQGGSLLGLFRQTPDEWFRGMAAPEERIEIESCIAARDAARKARDWAKADQMRQTLRRVYWVEIEDTPTGTKWRRIRNWLANIYEHPGLD